MNNQYVGAQSRRKARGFTGVPVHWGKHAWNCLNASILTVPCLAGQRLGRRCFERRTRFSGFTSAYSLRNPNARHRDGPQALARRNSPNQQTVPAGSLAAAELRSLFTAFFPTTVKSLKHWIKFSRHGARLRKLYFELGCKNLERVVFTATTGRSGTSTLTRLFAAIPGCLALHEPHPAMNGKALIAANWGDRHLVDISYEREKSVNIRRVASGCRYYIECNHLFIKTFYKNAIEDFGDRIGVIHLVREPLAVADSIYRLREHPGTPKGNEWWLDYRAPQNRIRLTEILESPGEFGHAFYKTLWYWFEIEARIAEWQQQFPEVPVFRIDTPELNDPERVFAMFDWLGMQYCKDSVQPLIGVRENRKEENKLLPGIAPEQAAQMLERFQEILGNRGYAVPNRLV